MLILKPKECLITIFFEFQKFDFFKVQKDFYSISFLLLFPVTFQNRSLKNGTGKGIQFEVKQKQEHSKFLKPNRNLLTSENGTEFLGRTETGTKFDRFWKTEQNRNLQNRQMKTKKY